MIAWFPLGVTTGSVRSGMLDMAFRSVRRWALSLTPFASEKTKFDARCASTASKSFSLTAFHMSFSYCSTPVACFQFGFLGSFQMDWAEKEESRSTAQTREQRM